MRLALVLVVLITAGCTSPSPPPADQFAFAELVAEVQQTADYRAACDPGASARIDLVHHALHLPSSLPATVALTLWTQDHVEGGDSQCRPNHLIGYGEGQRTYVWQLRYKGPTQAFQLQATADGLRVDGKLLAPGASVSRAFDYVYQQTECEHQPSPCSPVYHDQGTIRITYHGAWKRADVAPDFPADHSYAQGPDEALWSTDSPPG